MSYGVPTTGGVSQCGERQALKTCATNYSMNGFGFVRTWRNPGADPDGAKETLSVTTSLAIAKNSVKEDILRSRHPMDPNNASKRQESSFQETDGS